MSTILSSGAGDLSLCHLGYCPDSPKTVTYRPTDAEGLPEEMPFYLRQNCFRMRRDHPNPMEGFSDRFPCPYDLLQGALSPGQDSFFYQGALRRTESRWGVFWQGDFSEFTTPGSYQIEIDPAVSAPFLIADGIYDRLSRGFLLFLGAQRCGCEVPGVHPACHLDDGVLDRDGTFWPATGGWHDAGDFRKWLALTQGNLLALARIAERGHPGFHDQALEEIAWGNRLFHRMITGEGRVFEDVGGGRAPADSGLTYDNDWWFENHPGCYGNADDNRWTDNLPLSGDERAVRTTYNPLVQFLFVETQARASRTLPDADGVFCGSLAQRAWEYGIRKGHDGRTLFVAQELLAGLGLPAGLADRDHLRNLARVLLDRQERGKDRLSGFFYEKDRSDAFRSIAFAGLPALALLKLIEDSPKGLENETDQAREAVAEYCEGYLLADAQSNPFSLVPYGVYAAPEKTQTFRDAGGGRGVRTFMAPFNRYGIAHGTSSVLMGQAAVLAKASALLGNSSWRILAERQIQWVLGHNPLNRSLCNGIGYRQPIGYGFRVPHLPEAMVAGFIGRPDDTPYLEESAAIEWNTLEYWDVPYALAIRAILP